MLLNIEEVFPNPENPRVLRDEKYKKLKKSIQDFPEMLSLRPLVIDENNIVLGGNMRLRILKDLKYKEVEVIRASQLTEEQKKEFIIKDNVGFGDWDWDELANSWDELKLEEWGLDIPDFDGEEEEEEEPKEPAYELKLIFQNGVDYQSAKIEIIDFIQEKYNNVIIS